MHESCTHPSRDSVGIDREVRGDACNVNRSHKVPFYRAALTCPAGEAMEAGTPIAVCSTSNERAVATIVQQLLGPQVAARMRVFAGDAVPKKKPAPDIYNLAARELGVNPRMCACTPKCSASPILQVVGRQPCKSPCDCAPVVAQWFPSRHAGLPLHASRTTRRLSGPCAPCRQPFAEPTPGPRGVGVTCRQVRGDRGQPHRAARGARCGHALRGDQVTLHRRRGL